MDFATARDYCLTQPVSLEDFPFGPDVYVYKTHNKIFAILAQKDGVAYLSLKATPTDALMLRQLFSAVRPGYHLNKTHWNTIELNGSVPVGELQRQIEQSWRLVQLTLAKKLRFPGVA